jgi:hypothetical protein
VHLLLFIRLTWLEMIRFTIWFYFYLDLFIFFSFTTAFISKCAQPHCGFPSMLLMSQTQISDIPSFWSSSQFHATVANYSICPILIGLLRLTVANQSECRICQFSLRSDSTLMNLIVAKIDHIWATRYGVFLKDAIFQAIVHCVMTRKRVITSVFSGGNS